MAASLRVALLAVLALVALTCASGAEAFSLTLTGGRRLWSRQCVELAAPRDAPVGVRTPVLCAHGWIGDHMVPRNNDNVDLMERGQLQLLVYRPQSKQATQDDPELLHTQPGESPLYGAAVSLRAVPMCSTRASAWTWRYAVTVAVGAPDLEVVDVWRLVLRVRKGTGNVVIENDSWALALRVDQPSAGDVAELNMQARAPGPASTGESAQPAGRMRDDPAYRFINVDRWVRHGLGFGAVPGLGAVVQLMDVDELSAEHSGRDRDGNAPLCGADVGTVGEAEALPMVLVILVSDPRHGRVLLFDLSSFASQGNPDNELLGGQILQPRLLLSLADPDAQPGRSRFGSWAALASGVLVVAAHAAEDLAGTLYVYRVIDGEGGVGAVLLQRVSGRELARGDERGHGRVCLGYRGVVLALERGGDVLVAVHSVDESLRSQTVHQDDERVVLLRVNVSENFDGGTVDVLGTVDGVRHAVLLGGGGGGVDDDVALDVVLAASSAANDRLETLDVGACASDDGAGCLGARDLERDAPPWLFEVSSHELLMLRDCQARVDYSSAAHASASARVVGRGREPRLWQWRAPREHLDVVQCERLGAAGRSVLGARGVLVPDSDADAAPRLATLHWRERPVAVVRGTRAGVGTNGAVTVERCCYSTEPVGDAVGLDVRACVVRAYSETIMLNVDGQALFATMQLGTSELTRVLGEYNAMRVRGDGHVGARRAVAADTGDGSNEDPTDGDKDTFVPRKEGIVVIPARPTDVARCPVLLDVTVEMPELRSGSGAVRPARRVRCLNATATDALWLPPRADLGSCETGFIARGGAIRVPRPIERDVACHRRLFGLTDVDVCLSVGARVSGLEDSVEPCMRLYDDEILSGVEHGACSVTV